jgi:hypothetical protein
VKKVATPDEAVKVFDEFVKDLDLGNGSWPLLQEGIPATTTARRSSSITAGCAPR